MPLKRLYDIVEGGKHGGTKGSVFEGVAGAAILISTVATVLSTEPALGEATLRALDAVENVCMVLFAIEFFARVLVCTEDRDGRFQHPIWGRLHYMLTPLAVIDLVAILPGVLVLFGYDDAEFLLLLRCCRLLKLLRYFSAFETLATVVRNERKPLLASGTLLIIMLVLISTFAHLLEKDAQPDNFGSVPKAMWWGIVTLSTVGYGDVVPTTTGGRILGGFAVVIGMGLFALPAGIIATGFAEEMRRRNFVVTWTLVAKVPFFERLPASRIAEIASKLESRGASKGESIIKVGEPADAMFFIVEGEVDVQLPHTSIRLRAGDFFGEIALLSDKPRTATIVTVTFCQLLKLRTDHFRQLMDANQDLAESMRRIANERLAGSAPMPRLPDRVI
jgi:voltage-gated potassium channel